MQSNKMAVPSTTIPQTLTPSQARALLHTLLSTTPSNATRSTSTTASTSRPTSTSPKPTTTPAKQTKTLKPTQPQQHTITIDTSTRIMGHCNNIQLNLVSPTEQAARIEEMVRGALAATTTTTTTTTTNGNAEKKGMGDVNITINAGINLMGSKNTVVFGGNAGKKVEVKDAVPNKAGMVMESNTQMAGRKRRAESEPVDMVACTGKKVKVEV